MVLFRNIKVNARRKKDNTTQEVLSKEFLYYTEDFSYSPIVQYYVCILLWPRIKTI